MKPLGLLLSLLLLTACAASEDRSELLTQAAFVGRQRAELASTATVQTARLQTTLDYSGTRVGLAATQSQLLKSTLAALGTPMDVLDAFQRDFIGTIPTPAPPGDPASPRSPTPNRPLITPPAASPSPASGPRLEDIALTERVGADDCPIGNANSFSAQAQAIYVVARAVDAPSGTVFSSRWLLRNEEVIRYEFIPNFAIERACIWFYIDPQEVAFTPGPWAVILQVNGQDAAPPIAFTIRE